MSDRNLRVLSPVGSMLSSIASQLDIATPRTLKIRSNQAKEYLVPTRSGSNPLETNLNLFQTKPSLNQSQKPF